MFPAAVRSFFPCLPFPFCGLSCSEDLSLCFPPLFATPCSFHGFIAESFDLYFSPPFFFLRRISLCSPPFCCLASGYLHLKRRSRPLCFPPRLPLSLLSLSDVDALVIRVRSPGCSLILMSSFFSPALPTSLFEPFTPTIPSPRRYLPAIFVSTSRWYPF